jgi:glycosyltransferase involved in cell wall biosynthesis
MPYFNNAAHIKAALESYLLQTEEEIEIILYDDGSTDGSGELVRQISDPRIVLVESSRNRGISAAYNAAFALVRTDCTIFSGADDIAEKDRVAQTLAMLGQFSGAPAILASRVSIIDDEGNATGGTYGFPDFVLEGNVLIETLKRNYFLGAAMAVSHVSGLRLDETLPAGDDYDLALRLLVSGARWAFSSKPLVRYRIHGRNFSRDYQTMKRGAEAALQKYPEAQLRNLLVQRGSHRDEIEVALGIVQLFLGNTARADELLNRRFRDRNSDRISFEHAFYRGVVCYRKGNIQESLSSFAFAARIAPGEVTTMNNIAVLSVMLGQDRKAAEALLDAALGSQPNYLDAGTNLGALRSQVASKLKVTERLLPPTLLWGSSYCLNSECK